MTTEVKDVLNWLDGLCEQALTEARGGNAVFANRIGGNSSLKLYMDNVHGIKTVSREQFAAYYPAQMKECTSLYEAYLRDEQANTHETRLAVLEGKLDTLSSMLTTFIEAQQPADKKKPDDKKKPEAGDGKGEGEA